MELVDKKKLAVTMEKESGGPFRPFNFYSFSDAFIVLFPLR